MEVTHLKATKGMTRRAAALLGSLSLMTGLLTVVAAPPAVANHDQRVLEVTPETQTVEFGTPSGQLTATLSEPAGTETINIDWENEGDGEVTRSAPDYSCDIQPGQSSCSITVTGSGRDLFRAWVDEDRVQSTDDSDPDEGRCATSEEQGCANPDRNNPEPVVPGQNCPFFLQPTEGDCTDVVRVDFAGEAVRATFVDCDDTGGDDDTERETNRSELVAGVTGESTEVYECEVLDQFGNRARTQTVSAEIENGVNDPDPETTEQQPSYQSPDYQCTTGSTGSPCDIFVTQLEGELGTAEICFFLDDNNALTDEGSIFCAEEPTGEAEIAPGRGDVGNDLADQTELTFEDVERFILDCEPETDAKPAGTSHTVTCTVTSPTSGGPVSGVIVRAEATGANDPDSSNSPTTTPDFECTTDDDGDCSFTHGPGGEGTTTTPGTTTYRAFIDDEVPEPTSSGNDEDVDTAEGRDERTTPGRPEPDNTDVVENTFTNPPSKLTISPKNDTATVGQCNPYTIKVIDNRDAGIQGLTIDVEQVHETASSGNATANDEPTVSFCTPDSGPNPSDVDVSRGDRQPAPEGTQNPDEEKPDNRGTAGGETENGTDSSGSVTIGIRVTAGQGSDGTGRVDITAFLDANNNDDPDGSEFRDTAQKRWEPAPAPQIDCEPETARQTVGEQHTVTCTVIDASGNPDEGEGVTFTEDGPGDLTTATQVTTDASGRASVSSTSSEEGTQTIVGTITASQDQGSTHGCKDPGGVCSDSVAVTWAQEAPSCPGFEGDGRNQVVGTEGNDVLEGTDGADIICGLGGNDVIVGRDGADLLIGGAGNDTFTGGRGRDELRGGTGRDSLRAGSGHDVLRGGSGPDVLRGGPGGDILYGGRGNDTCNAGTGRNRTKSCEK